MSRKKHYAPRVPRSVNGFKAQDLRNPPRVAWWAKRWFASIDAMRLGGRGGRGRLYAEMGQVSELSVTGGKVVAKVMGARPDPYVVKLDFAPSKGIDEAFGEQDPMTLGRILAGELPISAGKFFAGPKISRDSFWCSCPDWSKPCKHIVAVLYLLGDTMIRDPSLALRLRGWKFPDKEAMALPLWKGTVRFEEAFSRIRRRVTMAKVEITEDDG